MSRRPLAACLTFALGMVLAAASAQAMDMPVHHAMASHGHHGCTGQSPATKAYQQAMVRMHATTIPLSGNPDVDFVRLMIPHHQAALDMAQAQLAYGKDETLKEFSRWVITAQTIEIGEMQNWLRGHDNGLSSASATDYYGPAMQRMHTAMMIDYSGDADADFVRGMIPHHQGAVDMASVWMAHGTNPELRPLVDGVFRAQTYEIAWQRHWLAKRHNGTHFPSFVY